MPYCLSIACAFVQQPESADNPPLCFTAAISRRLNDELAYKGDNLVVSGLRQEML
jgi:hypothetical protein